MKSQHALEHKQTDPPNRPIVVEAEKLIGQMQNFTQMVARRAYEFFEARGREIGHELEDWFRAESELMRPTPVELRENETQYIVRAEVPGFKANEINISAEPRRIILKGAKEQVSEQTEQTTVFSERRGDQFYREIGLSTEIDPQGVTASLNEGVLEVTLPKRPAKDAVDVKVKTN
jgi:HSP20 family protein